MDLKGLVLDLRGNPGGLLDAAVEIASYLVPPKSDIVSSKSKDGVEIVYRSTIGMTDCHCFHSFALPCDCDLFDDS